MIVVGSVECGWKVDFDADEPRLTVPAELAACSLGSWQSGRSQFALENIKQSNFMNLYTAQFLPFKSIVTYKLYVEPLIAFPNLLARVTLCNSFAQI